MTQEKNLLGISLARLKMRLRPMSFFSKSVLKSLPIRKNTSVFLDGWDRVALVFQMTS